jgi:uncharacterized membrane protein HdeD (DUF308 family)
MSTTPVHNIMLTDMHKNLAVLFGVGAVLTLLGIAGLYFKLTFTEIGMRYLGGLLLIAGGIQCIDVYRTEKWLTKFWRSLAVIVYLAGGMMMLVFPGDSSSLVSMLFGMMLIVMGVFRIIIALQTHKHMKLWVGVVLSGAVSICLGCFLLAQWPWPTAEVLGIFVSVELLLQGSAMLYMGYAAKTTHHGV